MIGTPTTDTLAHTVISGSATTGMTVTTRDGRPARLAVLDEDGNVIEAGDAVAREAWNVAIQCHRNFWQANGHLVVHTSPTGLVTAPPKGRARR
ncbi:class II aldolase/adducin head domain-containing protein [Aromatoleum toluclasticum]|uniref:hypothetical protein n=1 Tax=Aromatoleum toluclasticum TaxID=92003 RepID=UPI0003622D4B|nr:hypothetical protein [Aromatoleum toluclasticum]